MKDLWSYLQQAHKPIVLYGMGNGADKLISVLSAYGLEASDFFASDGFVRGHTFHGKRVLTLSEVSEKYDDFIIMLSFGSSLPELLERFEMLDREYEFYVPELPVAGNTLFTADYYASVKDELSRVRSLLADEQSKQVLDGVIEYRLTGKIKPLLATASDREEVFTNILHPARYRSCADFGAYNGDTISELLRYQPNLTQIWALEPDRRSYRKLMARAENETFADRLTALQAGAWCEDCTRSISDEGSRNSHLIEGGGKQVECVAPDSLFGGKCVDYIKYDVEGAEYEALLGSRRTIEAHTPDLAISLYHRGEDIWKLPLLVHSLNASYKLYLRRPPYIPPWDLCLYAVCDG